jgi:transcriptional regulator with XRE-family HTH domain
MRKKEIGFWWALWNRVCRFIKSVFVKQVTKRGVGLMATLVKVRKERKMTIKDMAARLGVRSETLSLYERGISEITLEKIELYADILDCELKVLSKEGWKGDLEISLLLEGSKSKG